MAVSVKIFQKDLDHKQVGILCKLKQVVFNLDKTNRCDWWDLVLVSTLIFSFTVCALTAKKWILSIIADISQVKTMQLHVYVLSFKPRFFTLHQWSDKLQQTAQRRPACHSSVLSFCPAQQTGQTEENMKGYLVLIVTPCLLITSNQSPHIHSEVF